MSENIVYPIATVIPAGTTSIILWMLRSLRRNRIANGCIVVICPIYHTHAKTAVCRNGKLFSFGRMEVICRMVDTVVRLEIPRVFRGPYQTP